MSWEDDSQILWKWQSDTYDIGIETQNTYEDIE